MWKVVKEMLRPHFGSVFLQHTEGMLKAQTAAFHLK